MTDNIRAAAERLRKHNDCCRKETRSKSPYFIEKIGSSCTWNITLWEEDRSKIEDAYLAEHPADDGEPVTEEWLRAIGFCDWPQDDDDVKPFDLFIQSNEEIGWETRLAYVQNGFYMVRMCDPDTHLGVAESVELFDSRNTTKKIYRHQLRHLLAALKEQP